MDGHAVHQSAPESTKGGPAHLLVTVPARRVGKARRAAHREARVPLGPAKRSVSLRLAPGRMPSMNRHRADRCTLGSFATKTAPATTPYRLVEPRRTGDLREVTRSAVSYTHLRAH